MIKWLKKRFGLWNVQSIIHPLSSMRDDLRELIEDLQLQNEIMRQMMDTNTREIDSADLVVTNLDHLFGQVK